MQPWAMEHYLEGHSTSPRVMIPATRAFHQTARSGAHGFRSHRLRPLLMLCKYCRIRVNSGMIYLSRIQLFGLLIQSSRKYQYNLTSLGNNCGGPETDAINTG